MNDKQPSSIMNSMARARFEFENGSIPSTSEYIPGAKRDLQNDFDGRLWDLQNLLRCFNIRLTPEDITDELAAQYVNFLFRFQKKSIYIYLEQITKGFPDKPIALMWNKPENHKIEFEVFASKPDALEFIKKRLPNTDCVLITTEPIAGGN